MRGRGRGLSDRREDRVSHYREEDREMSATRDKKKEREADREVGSSGDRKSQPKDSGDSSGLSGGAKPQRQSQPRRGKEGGEGREGSKAPASSKETNGTGANKKVEEEKVNNSRRK